MPEDYTCGCVPTFVPEIATEIRTFRTVCSHGMSQSVRPVDLWGRRELAAPFVIYAIECWEAPGEMMEDNEIRSTEHIECYLINWGEPDEFAIYKSEEGVANGEHSVRFARCATASQYSMSAEGIPMESWGFHGNVSAGEWGLMAMMARGLGEDLTTMILRGSGFQPDSES